MKYNKDRKIKLTRWSVITLIYGLTLLIYTVLTTTGSVTDNSECKIVAGGLYIVAIIALTILIVNKEKICYEEFYIWMGHIVAIHMILLLVLIFAFNTKNNTFLNILSDGNVVYRSEILGIWLKAIILAIASDFMVTIYAYVVTAVWKFVSSVYR